MTDSGDVNLDSVQMIMSDLGQAEDEIFKKRQQTELMFKARDKARKKREMQQRPNFNALEDTQFAPTVRIYSSFYYMYVYCVIVAHYYHIIIWENAKNYFVEGCMVL